MQSRGEVNKSLRSFIIISGIGGAWGNMIGMGTAVFAGFVLSLGADASDIAFYSAIASILAPVQIIASLFSKSIENKKGWVVWNGILETLFRGLIITIPFLFVESIPYFLSNNYVIIFGWFIHFIEFILYFSIILIFL